MARSGRRLLPDAWLLPLALGAVLVAVDHLTGAVGARDEPPSAAFVAAAVVGAAAAILGVVVNRPARPAGWRLIAASVTAFAGGQVAMLVRNRGDSAWLEHTAQAGHLTQYPLLALALGVFVRRRTPGWRPTTMIDTSIIWVGVALIWWVYLLRPIISGAGAIPVAYPLLDLLLLAVGVRFALGGGARDTSYLLLLAGTGALLLSDTVAGVAAVFDVTALGDYVAGPHALSCVLVGAAVLHPSMTSVDKAAAGAPPVTLRRLAGLAIATLLAPGVLLVQHARGSDEHTPVVASACAVLFLLVVTRLAGLLADQRRLAITDPLTGLHTRRHLEDKLVTACADLTTPVGLVIVDADHFKRVNDAHGHPAGDAVLVEIAERLRHACRTSDVVARYGGEEFAVVLAGTDQDRVAVVAERIRSSIANRPIAIAPGTKIRVTVSIGSSFRHREPLTPAELIRGADEALYEAKRAGRNRVVAATPPAPIPIVSSSTYLPSKA